MYLPTYWELQKENRRITIDYYGTTFKQKSNNYDIFCNYFNYSNYSLSRAEYKILRELKLKGGLTDNFYKWFNPQTKVFTQNDLKKALDIYNSVLK